MKFNHKGSSRIEPISKDETTFYIKIRELLIHLSSFRNTYLDTLNISYSIVITSLKFFKLDKTCGADDLIDLLVYVIKRIYKIGINGSKKKMYILFHITLFKLQYIIDNPPSNADDSIMEKYSCIIHIYSILDYIINKKYKNENSKEVVK